MHQLIILIIQKRIYILCFGGGICEIYPPGDHYIWEKYQSWNKTSLPTHSIGSRNFVSRLVPLKKIPIYIYSLFTSIHFFSLFFKLQYIDTVEWHWRKIKSECFQRVVAREGICILANTTNKSELKWNADVNTAMVVNMNNILKYVTNTEIINQSKSWIFQYNVLL